jgi:hypothetical protein
VCAKRLGYDALAFPDVDPVGVCSRRSADRVGFGAAVRRSPTRGTLRVPSEAYAPVVEWLVAAAVVAQLIAAILAMWRNPT